MGFKGYCILLGCFVLQATGFVEKDTAGQSNMYPTVVSGAGRHSHTLRASQMCRG